MNFQNYLWGYGDFMSDLRLFKTWCYKVLPLVYDDSLSYYEQLCKIYGYLNDIVNGDTSVIKDIEELKKEMAIVKEWIDNFDTSYAEEVLGDYIATMIFVEISESGYIIYYIPEKWEDIIFNTTGLDIEIDGVEYGRLVLSY